MARQPRSSKQRRQPATAHDGSTNIPPVTATTAQIVFGDSGLQRSGGTIRQETNNAKLDSAQGAKIYADMANNDPLIFGAMLTFSSLFRNAGWTVDVKAEKTDDKEPTVINITNPTPVNPTLPVNANPDAPTAAPAPIPGQAPTVETLRPKKKPEETQIDKDLKWTQEYLANMKTSWSDFMSAVTTMFTYGYAPIEVTYQKVEGKIVPERLDLRGQMSVEKWYFNEFGDAVAFEQQTERGMFYVPVEKCIFLRTINNMNSPVGVSVLRGAFRAWTFKKRILEIEGIGIERDLAGIPFARIPAVLMDANADDAQKAAFQSYVELVQGVRNDEKAGIIMPSDRDENGELLYDFQLLNSGGSREFNTTEIINRFDREIATSMMADFILVGQQGAGAYNLSSSKTELFTVALSAYLGLVEEAIQKKLIDEVWEFNGMDLEHKPVFKFNPIEMPDLESVSKYITNLSQAGAPMFPDETLENSLRERAGLPPVPEDRPDNLVADEDTNIPVQLGPNGQALPLGRPAKTPDETLNEADQAAGTAPPKSGAASKADLAALQKQFDALGAALGAVTKSLATAGTTPAQEAHMKLVEAQTELFKRQLEGDDATADLFKELKEDAIQDAAKIDTDEKGDKT